MERILGRRQLMWGMVALLLSCKSQSPQTPAAGVPAVGSVTGAKTDTALVLPEDAERALRAVYPGLRWPTYADFDQMVREEYPPTSRARPWAVSGDFTGDSLLDVAALIAHGDSLDLVVAVSSSAGYRVITLEPVNDEPSPRRYIGLVLVPAGDQGTNFNDEHLILRHEAFVRYYTGKAGTTYYWQDSAFHEFQSSD